MKTLSIWTGPVASSKTTKALSRARRLSRLGYKLPYVIRPSRCVRDHEESGYLVTKGSREKYPSIELDSAADIYKTAKNDGAVWVDEPMLWKDEERVFNQIQALRELMPVLVSGCAATSELTPFFTSLPKLIAVADEVFFCRADCDICGTVNSASRTICLAQKTETVLVGGEDLYKAACPKCWSTDKLIR